MMQQSLAGRKGLPILPLNIQVFVCVSHILLATLDQMVTLDKARSVFEIISVSDDILGLSFVTFMIITIFAVGRNDS